MNARDLEGGWEEILSGLIPREVYTMAGLGVHIIAWVVVPQCVVHIEPSAFLHMPAGFWSGVLICL